MGALTVFTSAFLFVIVAGAAPTAALQCSMDGLSEKCEFFKKNSDQAVFTLPDGSQFQNPLAKPVVQPPVVTISAEDQQKWQEQMEEAMNQSMDAQVDLQETLKDFDSKFQIAVSSPMTAYQIGMALSLESSGQPTSAMTLSLPWPPERGAQKPRIKSVKWAEFKSGFLDKLSPEKRERIVQQIQTLAKTQSYGAYGAYGGYGGAGGYGTSAPVGRLKNMGMGAAAPGLQEKDFARLEALVEKTKAMMLSEVSQGKPYSKLSGDQKAQYDKVASVRYVPPSDPKVANSPSCAGAVANAFYDPQDHTFSVCPAMASFPPASLVSVIAHEFAHPIDPCGSGLGVYKVNQEATTKAVAAGDIRAAKLMEQASSLTFTAVDSPKSFTGEAEKKGWIVREVPGVPFDRYPQQAAMKCLQKKIKFRTSDKRQMKRAFIEWSRKNPEFYGGKVLSEAEAEAMVAEMKGLYNPLCGGGFDGVASEAGEAMADAWAAKVLGRYFEESPPQTTVEKLSAFAIYFQAGGLCSDKSANSSPQSLTLDDPHLHHWERVDKVFLTDHRVRKAMACEGDPKDICLRSMGTLRTPQVGTTGGSAEASGKQGQK